MKIYIVRHGTTIWNEKRITQGYFQNRLSIKGKEELFEVSEILKDEKIDVIYSSPLFRSIQSANIINKHHNKKIIKDNNLIGINQGVFAGRFWDSLTEKEIKLHNKRHPSTGMESYENVYKRCKLFVKENIINSKFDTIVIVTHNTNATCIEYILKNITPNFKDSKFMNVYCNGEIKLINY